MIDFLTVSAKKLKDRTEIFPKFKLYPKSKDLMIRGGDFYAVWNEGKKLWSTDETDVLCMIDKELDKYADEYRELHPSEEVRILYMWDSSVNSIDAWHKYVQKQSRDSYHMLDETLIFSNTEVSKDDYASKTLSYPLKEGPIEAYDKLMSTLYDEEERRKIEWAIGAIVTGDSKTIQKFLVLYGAAGTGKSTVLNIIQQLFEGYYSVFDAKALGSSNNSFALEAFKTNPLVAIQHDGDLSRIEDNTKLNSLVSHELMTINEKFKSTYENRFKCFLFMGTNKPVKITDGKSGLLRRLIDVHPSGRKLPVREYNKLVKQIPFELGAIAWHCKEVYESDPGRYDNYIPTEMMGASNDFYNFVVESYRVFMKEGTTTLKSAWAMYKEYCEDAKVPYPMSQRAFKEELKNYFWHFDEKGTDSEGKSVRNVYTGFRTDIFESEKKNTDESADGADGDTGQGSSKYSGADDDDKPINSWLVFDGRGMESEFDRSCCDCPAQYATKDETPMYKWDKVKTKLSDLDTSKLHYVKVPENHIVIDFDIKDEDGNKSFEKNLEAASRWPPTYAEVSKGGNGIHLHYLYSGDPSKLAMIYDTDIEIKVFRGKSSLRRKLTKFVNLAIATISSGLPLKGDDKVIDFEGFKNEKSLRAMIKRNLNKEISPYTRPSVDFIFNDLEKAYESGMSYDVSDLKNSIFAFAAQSSHQSDTCIKIVNKMKLKSEDRRENVEADDDKPLVFYDIEVFPNLFLVNWKIQGKGKPVVRMINPKPKDIEELVQFRLVGFNCRRYDNHILYAAMMGYDNEALYNLSQKIINSPKGSKNNGMFGEAYNLSYTDVYDFAAKKQSLKKWEIELGIHHQELGLPWDQPVPEELWPKVAEYCDNDVIATEAVFDHLKGDFTARKILAALAGMTVNDTTNSLTTRIIFGKERHPKLVYTDLATGKQEPTGWERTDIKTAFPGYEYKDGKNIFRGVDLGLGGYVYAEPGMYGNVALLDIASLHPNSTIAMNCFGEFTQNYKDILDARIYIKHGEFDKARHMLGGKLAPYLDDESTAKDLAQALKIAINSVYGLTSASFENPFRDIRNKNNIVALRGALFMKTLQDAVVDRGFTVCHIKTDSIKIPDATPEIIQFCMDFAKEYGYTFEHEATYDRMCLVNNAVYIARYKSAEECQKMYGYIPGDCAKHGGEWTATGKQFQVPYVFKTLFSHEQIDIPDLSETFEVKTALYLDMNEPLPDVSNYEKEIDKVCDKYKKGKISDVMFESMVEELLEKIAEGHDYRFVGKVGSFCPVKPGKGGGLLMREKDGKYYAATGTIGYRWLESETMTSESNKEFIDMSYYNNLVADAVDAISEYGDFAWFTSEEEYNSPPRPNYDFMNIPEDSPEELPWD